MATAEDLRERIAAAQHDLQAKTALRAQLQEDIDKAIERQRLRRELEGVEAEIASRVSANSAMRWFREAIDADSHGNVPDAEGIARRPLKQVGNVSPRAAQTGGEVVNCGHSVVKGEYVWKIEGFSWLVNALQQNFDRRMQSEEIFTVGGEKFSFVYHPKGRRIGEIANQRGSLAIVHLGDNGITFRYTIFIKNRKGDFVQWGDIGDECHPTLPSGKAFGPDVQIFEGGARGVEKTIGIFGLSHKELLQSEWVTDDVLTAKFQLEVRRDEDYDVEAFKPSIEVPLPTLTANLLSLLEEGKQNDVTFVIDGESIKAHSQILCARSEVFDTQLNGGMRESLSKQIVIDDCDAATFKALLKFLYTDSFSHLEEMVKAERARSSSGSDGEISDKCVKDTRSSVLQNVLAVSHKYHVMRLRMWCEQQLCECISVASVCSILCQAHLYETKQLEGACLAFIKENMEAVVVTSAFGSLGKEWPAVMLKISVFTAGVLEQNATSAFDAQKSRKRKHSD